MKISQETSNIFGKSCFLLAILFTCIIVSWSSLFKGEIIAVYLFSGLGVAVWIPWAVTTWKFKNSILEDYRRTIK